MATQTKYPKQAFDRWKQYTADWCLFAREYLRVDLDEEQEAVLRSVQKNPKTAVASGTSRGKDYVAAVAAICFLYLTPRWDASGKLVANTKVICTGPTERQVKSIMMPEITRVFRSSIYLPGVINSSEIKTPYEEWFLLAFKAGDKNMEAWSGYHAANILFIVTEATGVPQLVFDAIEGNLQGNSRLLLVFNPNISVGYAASAMKNPIFTPFKLNSLNAPNVRQKKVLRHGQVDYRWIADRIKDWCTPIQPNEVKATENDFEFEERWYRPNDLFRAKVLGEFPKVSEDVLVPPSWIDLAVERWKKYQEQKFPITKPLRLGTDVAGMGRDNSMHCPRYGDLVMPLTMITGNGATIHMQVAGATMMRLKQDTDTFTGRYAQAFIDTIGEGAGTYSRLVELAQEKGNEWLKVFSCKFSEAATDDGDRPLTDCTGEYKFFNMRAYLFWAIRDWLNPEFNSTAMLPPDSELAQELSEIRWHFRSDGKIQVEEKEEIKKRLKRSPDRADALANTFYPVPDFTIDTKKKKQNIANFFH